MKKRTKVFVGNRFKGKALSEDIKRQFKPFLSKRDFWGDSNILSQQNREEEIEKGLMNPKLTILFFLTNSLRSGIILKNEFLSLLKSFHKDGATILIATLIPCLFKDSPKLKQYESMGYPSNPALNMHRNKVDNIYVKFIRRTVRPPYDINSNMVVYLYSE